MLLGRRMASSRSQKDGVESSNTAMRGVATANAKMGETMLVREGRGTPKLSILSNSVRLGNGTTNSPTPFATGDSDRTSPRSKRPRKDGHGGTGKKWKGLDARSYRALFEPRKSTVVAAPVRMNEKNASGQNVADNNAIVGCEEGGGVLQEWHLPHSGEAVDEASEGSHDMMLETDGLQTRAEQPLAPFSEVQSHKHMLEARERPAGLANQNCVPASPSQTCFPIRYEEAIEDNGAIGIQGVGSNSRQFEVNSNNDMCVTCKTPGILKCCDGKGCKRRYHISCLNPPLEHISPGIWLCTICTKKRVQYGVYSITEGVESLWDVKGGMQNGKQYFVKYKGLAHVYNHWVPESDVLNDSPGGPDLLAKFNKRNHKEKTIKWKKEWTVPHRLLKKRMLMLPKEADELFNSLGDKFTSCSVEWLVKWRDLGYEHSTWELETSPFLCTPEAEELKKNYEYRIEAAKTVSDPVKANKVKQSLFNELQRLPDRCPPGLCDDHLSSINRLREFCHKYHSAVFIDGQECVSKTILLTMSVLPDVSQPFLIVSPSASLSLWEDKFNHLAPSINVVVYNGKKDARKLIQDLEFYEKGGCVMLQVLISHPDAILEDIEAIKSIGWEAVIVDCQNSGVSKCLGQLKRLSTNFRMVLLSSPLKGNIPQYINLLGFLDSGEEDMSPVVSNDDSIDTADPLVLLKARFARYVAYKCKADYSNFLEYWVPARLSQEQLALYCSTILSNSSTLRSYSKTDSVGALRDVLISLQKCCDHPYLVDQSLESKLTKDHHVNEILDIRVHASGKLLLLDNMLKEIQSKGLRVVILFQSGGGRGNPMGHILNDVVCQRFGPESYEFIESGLLMSKKQAAMSMFNDKTKGRFVLLIENRACLPSIKLASVDAVIIYSSDWNPLNDLRNLRKISIGSQSEHVSIFRLYSSLTAEEKSLVLAKQGIVLDSNIQNIMPSISHSLLSWGASFLFNRLDEFQQDNYSSEGSDGDKHFMDKVVLEFLTKLRTKFEASKEINNSAISKAYLSGASYSRSITLVGERDGISALDGDPSTFWSSLLDGRAPCQRYIFKPSQGSRRNVQNIEEKVTSEETDEGRRKRRKIGEINGSSPKVIPDKNRDIVLPENTTLCSSSQHSLDDTSQELGVRELSSTQKSFHAQLNSELSKLCEVLQLPENVKCLSEELLEYILKNHLVGQEPKHLLHACNISLCWHAASLLKHKVDHTESLALAAKYLNYECNDELAGFAYIKLRILKKLFSRKGCKTANHSQATLIKNKSSRQETSTDMRNDDAIPNHAASEGANFRNSALQEVSSGDFCTKKVLSEGKELISVSETCRQEHLSSNELVIRITEKIINLVDMVFSLRKKNIHDRQQHEISKLDTYRAKEVVKLKEVCNLVLQHIHRSDIDLETRNRKVKLITEWFTMLLYAFWEHMRSQCDKFEALQSTILFKEQQLKEKFQHEAESGQLDQSFDCSVPLPDSNFALEEFSYFSEQDGDFHTDGPLVFHQQSLGDTSTMDITLKRNILPSEAISTEVVRNGPVEDLVRSEGGQTSEAVDFLENRTNSSSEDIGLQGELPQVACCSSSSSPANDGLTNQVTQESSTFDLRSTEHVEGASSAGSSLSQGGGASHHHVTMEVNENNNGNIASYPIPCVESSILNAQSSQATLPVSMEVETHTDLTNLSAKQIVASSRQSPAEAEPAGVLGVVAARCLQPEMQAPTFDLRSTERVEGASSACSSLSQGGEASLHHVTLEVNENNNNAITSDPVPCFESSVLNAQSSQATLPVSREVETLTDLLNLSAQQTVVPSRQASTEAEPADVLGVAAARHVQPEMQSSTAPLERMCLDDCTQICHQPEAAPVPALPRQLFPMASMMFNHLYDEPLKNESHRLRLYGDFLSNVHEQKKSELRAEYNLEIEKIIMKYDSLLQDEDSTYLQRKKKLDYLYEKVLVNQSLAEDFQAQFVPSSAAKGRAPSPPMWQPHQAFQQEPMRTSMIGATASPVSSSSAARPPMPTSFPSPRSLVQPSQVARPSSSPQAVRSPLILPGNPVRATSSPLGQIRLPHGSYGIRSTQVRGPAPHLLHSRRPLLYSVHPTNQQQLPARLGVASGTQVTPANQINLTSLNSQAVPSVTSTRSSSHPVLPATLLPSSSCTDPLTTSLASSSHSVLSISSLPSSSNPVLPATLQPSNLNIAPCSTSGLPDTPFGSRYVTDLITEMHQLDSGSAALDLWLRSNLGLSSERSFVVPNGS